MGPPRGGLAPALRRPQLRWALTGGGARGRKTEARLPAKKAIGALTEKELRDREAGLEAFLAHSLALCAPRHAPLLTCRPLSPSSPVRLRAPPLPGSQRLRLLGPPNAERAVRLFLATDNCLTPRDKDRAETQYRSLSCHLAASSASSER